MKRTAPSFPSLLNLILLVIKTVNQGSTIERLSPLGYRQSDFQPTQVVCELSILDYSLVLHSLDR